MRYGVGRSIVTFLLVLALTAGAVIGLSMATSAKEEPAAVRYSREVRASQTQTAAELSAPVHREGPPPANIGAFVLMLGVVAGGVTLVLRTRKTVGRKAVARCSRYSPRADRTFQSPGRSRV